MKYNTLAGFHHFVTLQCPMLRTPQKHRRQDADLCFNHTRHTVNPLRRDTKSVVGVFVLTHRFQSCPISGFTHGWPVCTECFHWCGYCAELQRWSGSLSRRHEGTADVFGVILAPAVARLSCLTQRPDVSTGGAVHEFTKIAPEGDKEFNLVGTRGYKNVFFCNSPTQICCCILCTI